MVMMIDVDCNGKSSHAHEHCSSEASVEDVDDGEECDDVEDRTIVG